MAVTVLSQTTLRCGRYLGQGSAVYLHWSYLSILRGWLRLADLGEFHQFQLRRLVSPPSMVSHFLTKQKCGNSDRGELILTGELNSDPCPIGQFKSEATYPFKKWRNRFYFLMGISARLCIHCKAVDEES